MEEGRLKVIIAGAGIAGLATGIALRQLPYIDVELYERSPELKEIGASIALSPNGLRTLERLGVGNALDDEVAFRGPAGIPMIYRHWKTNEIVSVDHFEAVADLRHHTARFHRAHLHQALLQHVPRELIHLNKKVIGARVGDNTASLEFQDGTTAVGDLLIGADGINSKVRKAFVPHFQLSYTNRTALRATFDLSLVKHIPDLPADSTHWWGQDRNFFASRLGRNQFTVVGMYNPVNLPQGYESDIGTWNDVGSVELFRELYRDWNPVVHALTEATPSVRRFPNYAGQAIATWVFGSCATLVGDAAHAHGGAHATGGSLALDDAYALFMSLRHVIPEWQSSKPSEFQLQTALELYEETRRPHTDRLLRSVHSSMKDTPPQSDEELRRKMLNRGSTTWLSEHDVQKTFAAVVAAHTERGDTLVRESRL
ncbi:salicylate hydroxylase, variant [Fonsecaea erecta]|uniref:Salicylate hydroxylase, variant n=1 Tax=Fonsecaea erecta TaxID=1367422 RepID=A0A178Z6B2_9EURO|nr:salicylate hydroxylase, variant [Fonsecaea erecta]OAP55242.1 salicylate hydroxylase, variant [Fonsecaea erecta]